MAKKPQIDVDACPLLGFGLPDELERGQTPWHSHQKHQLLFASSGALTLEVAESQWLLPPQRGALIAASVSHRVRCRQPVSLRTIYLEPSLVPIIGRDCCVFAVSPLARELILHAMRWGPHDEAQELVAQRYFEVLGLLLPEWLVEEFPLELPAPRTAELRRAFDYALDDLESATMHDAARAARVSERTLSRRFLDETGQSWRQFLRSARVLRAMELLAQPGNSVTDVAYDVGFEDAGTLTRAFRELIGETATGYQQQLRAAERAR